MKITYGILWMSSSSKPITPRRCVFVLFFSSPQRIFEKSFSLLESRSQGDLHLVFAFASEPANNEPFGVAHKIYFLEGKPVVNCEQSEKHPTIHEQCEIFQKDSHT